MSLFDWLLVGHLMGDFLLQTDKMAFYKLRNGHWLLWHVAVYMIAMTLILSAYAWTQPVPLGLVTLAWLFILITHIFLDRRHFVPWWMERMGVSPDQLWLRIVVDQVFHLLSLAIVAQVLDWASRRAGSL